MTNVDETPHRHVVVPGTAVLFGYEPTPVDLHLVPRPTRWRVGGAVRIGAVAGVLTPLAAVVPPHAPWALGVLGTGAILVHRRLNERFTVSSADGACPKCGGRLSAGGGRLRRPHPASCESCHNEFGIEVAPGAIDEISLDA